MCLVFGCDCGVGVVMGLELRTRAAEANRELAGSQALNLPATAGTQQGGPTSRRLPPFPPLFCKGTGAL